MDFLVNLIFCNFLIIFSVIYLKTDESAKLLTRIGFGCLWIGCDLLTTDKKGLRRHIKVKHLNIRQFSCDDCPFSTARSARLYVHRKAKHNIDFILYKCDKTDCDFKTTNNSLLERHIRSNRHSKNIVNNIPVRVRDGAPNIALLRQMIKSNETTSEIDLNNQYIKSWF